MGWRKVITPKFTETETLMKQQFGFKKKLKKVITKSGWIRKVKIQTNRIGDFLSVKNVKEYNDIISGKEKLRIR